MHQGTRGGAAVIFGFVYATALFCETGDKLLVFILIEQSKVAVFIYLSDGVRERNALVLIVVCKYDIGDTENVLLLKKIFNIECFMKYVKNFNLQNTISIIRFRTKKRYGRFFDI